MSVEVIHGDCLDVMSRMPTASIDAIITDPPFAFAGGLSNGMTSRADSQFFEHWLVDVCKELIRIVRPTGCMGVWCDWRTASVLDRALERASARYEPWYVTQMLVHNREMIGMGKPFRNQCDFIAVVRGRKTDFGDRIANTTPNWFSEYSYYGKHANHPAEKTVGAARRLVDWLCPVGGMVFDPFTGSGTTGVAAVDSGRSFLGIEKDEGYAVIARQRLADAQSHISLGVA